VGLRRGAVAHATSTLRRRLMKNEVTTKKYLHRALFFAFIAAFVFFGRGAPTAEAADIIKTCTSISGDNCVIAGGSPVGGSGHTDMTCLNSNPSNYCGTFTGAYPTYDTGESNSWQNSNTQINMDSLADTIGNPSTFWVRFKDMGGAGNDWVYQFNYNGTVYSQGISTGVIINSPTNNATLQDFQNWNITWAGLSTNMKQMGIHYSDDLSKLEECETFPYGASTGYTECYNDTTRIWTDYGAAYSAAGGTVNVPKSRTLTLGETYYAQAVVQVTDQMGINLAVSPIISFIIGVDNEEIVNAADCGTFDIICYIKAGGTWLFVPSDEALESFDNLTLENSLPFSYIYDLENLYDDAFNQSADDFSIDIDLMGDSFTLLSTAQLEAVPFQSLVRTIMGAIAMFITAMVIYRKIIKVHDPHHQTV